MFTLNSSNAPKRIHEWLEADGSIHAEFFKSDAGYWVRFPALADFFISSDGKTVERWPVAGLTEATLEHLYLNQALPLALSRQGKLVFHGSAVSLPAGAVAFAGRSGLGKSTIAASFASAGYPFLTDDALLLEIQSDHLIVTPSHPSIRLWEDSKSKLVGDGALMAPAVQITSKSRLLSGAAIPYCPQPQPLRAFYFLGEGNVDQVGFQALSPQDVILLLVKNSFLLDVEERDAIGQHFQALCDLASQPIFFHLDYPRRYDVLPAVREAVIHHASQVV